MHLSKKIVNSIDDKEAKAAKKYFELPEKVLQFGTGVLLRGLPDYFIDKANKQGLFNGRIVVVKSTAGEVSTFEKQDSLYTLCVRGMEHGSKVEENIINASVSRVLQANNNWNEILKYAANADMQVIISNTTEVGITLIKDDIHALPPQSFPGKLLAFLYKRYTFFEGNVTKGMVIIPTELMPDNGNKLLEILLQLSQQNGLENSFADWLKNCNYFCNSLVDRIVPGRLPEAQQRAVEKAVGYTDELMIMCEPYRLWAIESDKEEVKKILSFSEADKGVVIAPDITIFRELKLRLLNGSHTFSCGLAHLAGFITVKEAMKYEDFNLFIQSLMLDEIAAAIESEKLTGEQTKQFALQVLERYRNPYIEHKWLNICLQYSSKMALRNVPVIISYLEKFGSVPSCIALGFAAHILFMKVSLAEDGKYYGEVREKKYSVNDDNAFYYAQQWKQLPAEEVVKKILSNENFWKTDLTKLNGFAEAVMYYLLLLMNNGAAATLREFNNNNINYNSSASF